MRIFFDVDGVLIDGWHSNSALRKPWDAAIHADLGVDREAFQSLFFGSPGARSASPMHECVVGRRDLASALADILPRVGYRGRVEDFMRYWFEKDSNVSPGVLKVVEALRGTGVVRMYVATGQEHHRAGYLWNELGFSRHFDSMFYSAEIGYAKSDVRFFEAINRALPVDPEEAPLFFDDQPEIVDVAKRAGWDAMIFTAVDDIAQHPRLRRLSLWQGL